VVIAVAETVERVAEYRGPEDLSWGVAGAHRGPEDLSWGVAAWSSRPR
jgi:hypothetical protein